MFFVNELGNEFSKQSEKNIKFCNVALSVL